MSRGGARQVSGGLRRGPILGGSLVFSLFVLLYLLFVEVLGRLSTSDLGDGAALVTLLVLAVVVVLRHRCAPVPWLERLSKAAARRLVRSRLTGLRFGVDLRGEPPLVKGIPAPLADLTQWLGLAFLIAFGLALAGLDFDVLRAHIAPWFVLGWLLVVGGVWLLSALTALAAAGAAASVLGPLIVGAGQRGTRASRLRLVLFYAVSVVVPLASAAMLPTGFAAAVIAAALMLGLPPHLDRRPPRLDFMLGTRAGEVVVIDWRRAFALVLGTGLVLGMVPILLVAGREALSLGDPGSASTSTPLSRILTRVTAWSLASAAVQLDLAFLLAWWWGRRNDPARSRPLRLALRGPLETFAGAGIRALARQEGFRIESAEEGEAGPRVRLRLVDDGAGLEPQPGTIDLATTAVVGPELADRIRARADRQARRAARRGCLRLFALSHRRFPPTMRRFVFAPHLWHLAILTAVDEEGEADGGEGPLLEADRLLGMAARAYLHRVLRAVAVDLLYLDRALPRRCLGSALDALFEHFDLFGSSRPFDERRLQGIPGLRVSIQEQGQGAPVERSAGDSDSEDSAWMGRVRILVLKRDDEEGEGAPPRLPLGSRRLPTVV